MKTPEELAEEVSELDSEMLRAFEDLLLYGKGKLGIDQLADVSKGIDPIEKLIEDKFWGQPKPRIKL